MAKNLFEGDTKLKFENFSNPGVECEIAVILSDEYDYKKKYDNLEDLISKVVSSIEVVDDRWPNYKKESTPLLIADNFFSSTIVHSIGVDKIDLNSLKNLKGKMKVNNKIIGNGEGKDILEDPLNALKWFLEFNFEQNNAPQSGDLISLGSLVKTYWVSKNDTITVDIEELGKIEAKFI